MLVDSRADQLMIRFDEDGSGEVFAERENRHPTDRNAGEEQPEADAADETRRELNAANPQKTQNHAHHFRRVSDVPDLRRMLVPVLSWFDSKATQIWILDGDPHHANYSGDDRK